MRLRPIVRAVVIVVALLLLALILSKCLAKDPTAAVIPSTTADTTVVAPTIATPTPTTTTRAPTTTTRPRTRHVPDPTKLPYTP